MRKINRKLGYEKRYAHYVPGSTINGVYANCKLDFHNGKIFFFLNKQNRKVITSSLTNTIQINPKTKS